MPAVVVDTTKFYMTSATARAYPLSYFGINFDVPYATPYQGRTEVGYTPQAFYPEEPPEDTIIATLTIARSKAEPLVVDPEVPESMQNSFFLNVPTDLGFVSAMNMARSADGLYVMRQTEVGDPRTEREDFVVNMNDYPETSAEDVGFLTFLGSAEDIEAHPHLPLPPDYPTVTPRAP